LITETTNNPQKNFCLGHSATGSIGHVVAYFMDDVR
jgi:hypothetical protein